MFSLVEVPHQKGLLDLEKCAEEVCVDNNLSGAQEVSLPVDRRAARAMASISSRSSGASREIPR
jgi:hypothetical protein